ncbi:MAG: hypothetical protein ACYCU8_11670 [Ferrimicrobium acidiphilum]
MDGEWDLARSAIAARPAGLAQGSNSGVHEGVLDCPVPRLDELAAIIVVSRNWIDIDVEFL